MGDTSSQFLHVKSRRRMALNYSSIGSSAGSSGSP